MATTRRPKLGSLLVEDGSLSEESLAEALDEQRSKGGILGHILVERGYVSEAQLARSLARHFKVDFVDLDEIVIDRSALALVPPDVIRVHGVVPIGWSGRSLIVAMANPSDVVAVDDIRVVADVPVKRVMVEASKLQALLRHAKWLEEQREAGIFKLDEDEPENRDVLHLDQISINEDEPAVRLLNGLIVEAVDRRASDIHIEPTEGPSRARFRIDGVLLDAIEIPRGMHPAVISRIKVMAGIDISERRVPQDGRASVVHDSHDYDLRVVTLPTAFGESTVIRILGQDEGLSTLDQLEMLPEVRSAYESALDRPWGTTLVTGPTGSGKTTTVYATLARFDHTALNIVTVEDPIEYRLGGIKQIQVNRKAGLTFPGTLRSILRADPDVVFIGEIRDSETARIAIDAALTGHRVLTTLHTNDAASTPIRLIEMDLEPYLVTAAVDAVLAQRLVRRLCVRCRQPYNPSERQLQVVGWPREMLAGGVPEIFRPVGCGTCANTGYLGRLAIFECLNMTDNMRQLVMDRAPLADIRRLAVEQGTIPLREYGFRKVAAGHTTIEELLRVLM